MDHSTRGAVRSVLKIYQDLDRQIDNLKRITGLKCPEGCGMCCNSPDVEASILELLPLAEEIYLQGQEEKILETIDLMIEQGDTSCLLYREDIVIEGNGRCLYYSYRPLICRLFGFAARKNKYGHIEFTPCKNVKQKTPHLAQRAEIAVANGLKPPLYQESALRVATLWPSLGFKRYPINQVIREALAFLQWRRPVKPKHRKAA